MNNLNNKQNKKPYSPSFEPREPDLDLTSKERSVDRLIRLTLDTVSDETGAVLDFTNMVSEDEKWEEVKTIKHEFQVIEETIAKVLKNPLIKNREEKPDTKALKALVESLLNYTNILEVELNSSEAVNALGRENIYLLNALLDILKDKIDKLVKLIESNPEDSEDLYKAVDSFEEFKNSYFEKLYSGFITEDQSSEPVQIQVFDNLTKALWIPPYPLADIVSLHDEYNSRKPEDDYAQIMKDRFKKFLEPKKEELEKQIAKEKERALKLKEEFGMKVNPKFKELLIRYADYWISMTPEKLYEYIIKRRAVENLAEGRVNLDNMEMLYKAWAEMANQRPSGQQNPSNKSNLAVELDADFKTHLKKMDEEINSIPKGEEEAPDYEDY